VVGSNEKGEGRGGGDLGLEVKLGEKRREQRGR